MNAARGTLAIIAMLGVVALMSAPSACSSGPPACSDGPPRTSLSQKQPTRSTSVGCQPRCGFTQPQPGRAWPVQAVPSGACDRDEYICEMGVFDGCATHQVQCECLDDEWQCFITFPGAAVCRTDAAVPVEASVPSCSNGPPRVTLEQREEKKSNGTCVPRCSSSAPDGSDVRSLDAVPSGPCDVGDYVCNLLVSDGCTTNEVQCECLTAAWQCGIVRTGPNTCTDAEDAGDAATD